MTASAQRYYIKLVARIIAPVMVILARRLSALYAGKLFDWLKPSASHGVINRIAGFILVWILYPVLLQPLHIRFMVGLSVLAVSLQCGIQVVFAVRSAFGAFLFRVFLIPLTSTRTALIVNAVLFILVFVKSVEGFGRLAARTGFEDTTHVGNSFLVIGRAPAVRAARGFVLA